MEKSKITFAVDCFGGVALTIITYGLRTKWDRNNNGMVQGNSKLN